MSEQPHEKYVVQARAVEEQELFDNMSVCMRLGFRTIGHAGSAR